MPLDFPNGPVTGDLFQGPGNITWRWDGTKWTSVLSSGGLFLPLSGGEMSGPLVYTATGGTTKHSAQDRAADVANVLDFGADPTGVLDSTAAINAAAARPAANGSYLKTVYLPAGQYHIKGQITLKDGQSLRGDGQGNTVLTVSDDFNPAATSVILIGNSVIDPGPTIRDLRIAFAQPSDVSSRATFKTLAAGGTSGTGGTGVQYPWVISQPASGGTGRVSIQNVRIEGAWNGITDGGNSGIYWVNGLQICAINVGFDLGSVGIFDWTHWSDIEFWPFGFTSTSQNNVWRDGQTTAMRLGQLNGLVAQNISCFYAKVVITTNATNGWFQFTNLSMDGSGSTITVGACFFLQFTNLYHTSGADAPGPLITTAGGSNVRSISISNWFAFASSSYPMIDLSGGGNLDIVNARLAPQNTAAGLALVTAGVLRIANALIRPTNASPWTVPLIQQNNTGAVQLMNLWVTGDVGSGGTAVAIGTDNAQNIVGPLSLAAGWANTYAARVNGQYGPFAPTVSPTFTGTLLSVGQAKFNAGLTFNGNVASGPTDLSKHIELYAGYGISLTGGRINYVVPTSQLHAFMVNGVDQLTVSSGQLTCTPSAKFTGFIGFQGAAPTGKATGYSTPTGTATRATFATSSVTLPVLAEHVKALIDDLTAYGLIGP